MNHLKKIWKFSGSLPKKMYFQPISILSCVGLLYLFKDNLLYIPIDYWNNGWYFDFARSIFMTIFTFFIVLTWSYLNMRFFPLLYIKVKLFLFNRRDGVAKVKYKEIIDSFKEGYNSAPNITVWSRYSASTSMFGEPVFSERRYVTEDTKVGRSVRKGTDTIGEVITDYVLLFFISVMVWLLSCIIGWFLIEID